MSRDPRPLEPGWRLNDRFEIKKTLGRGGFGIAYLASDLLRGDEVVIKELAPQGLSRLPSGLIRFEETTGQRLREQFLEEASVLSRFNLAGVPPIRSTFRENGTAYFAMDYVPESQTIQNLLLTEGRLPLNRSLKILKDLLSILDEVHARRILHRDIKPSNILISDRDKVHLIDFGSAREWHADSTTTHTVFHTPGYAPPEQLSERGRRGPATDLYALCATFYSMTVGFPPPSAGERASGVPLTPLAAARPEINPTTAYAIERGLSLNYIDRPQTVGEFLDLLEAVPISSGPSTLADLDNTLARLQAFRFDKRACPACHGVLNEPKPLKRLNCPVCRTGSIRKRQIHDRLCPICKAGVLSPIANVNPIVICPSCRFGRLAYRKKSLLSTDQSATCHACDAKYEVRRGQMAKLDEEAVPRTFEEWRTLSGRSKEIWHCEDCAAQFDLMEDSRWLRISPADKKGHRILFPEEWARVAVGLDPGAGNAECDGCEADYYLEGEKITLLTTKEDPFEFGEMYHGRLLTVEDIRWLGVGKASPNPGLVCEDCRCEFDRDQQYYRLAATSHRHLAKFIDQPKVLEDWHRLGEGLPTIHEEESFQAGLSQALREAYRNGEVSLDSAIDTL